MAGEVFRTDKENVREVDWVKTQIKDELNKLSTLSGIDSFYEVKTKEVECKMDVVKEYLETIKGKEKADLMKENTSAWIMSVQIALESVGYDVGTIDGIFGEGSTKEAVKRFQNEWNNNHPDDKIEDDGVPGPKTIEKLLEKVKEKYPDTESKSEGESREKEKKKFRGPFGILNGEFGEAEEAEEAEEGEDEENEGFYGSIDNFNEYMKNAELLHEVEYIEYDLGKHESSKGNEFLTDVWTKKQKESYYPSQYSDIFVEFGSGTDMTPIVFGKFTEEEFKKKKEQIEKFIEEEYLGPNKGEIWDFVHGCDFGTKQRDGGFTNERLLGMRNLECVKKVIESYNKGVETDSKFGNKRLHFAYNPKMNIAGTNRNEVKERHSNIHIRYGHLKDNDPGYQGDSENGK